LVNSAGLLTVRGQYSAGELKQLGVDLQRPSLTRLFIGQPPTQVAKAIPHLYSLCAEAQGAVARAALQAAGAELTLAVNDQRLWIEFLHENLWRLLLDWPVALGVEPEKAAFVAWRAARHDPAVAVETARLCDQVLRPLSEKCLKRLVHRAPTESTATSQFYWPSCCAGASSVPLGGSFQANSPVTFNPAAWLVFWKDSAANLPANIPPTSVSAAYQARLAAVAEATAALRDGRAYPIQAMGEGGLGVAQIRTARGVLTHAAELAGGVVSRYQVWAPTDVFFCDETALLALLAGQTWGNLDQMRQGLNQAILALDPCLPYVMELNDA
jgi:hypothetical protein